MPASKLSSSPRRYSSNDRSGRSGSAARSATAGVPPLPRKHPHVVPRPERDRYRPRSGSAVRLTGHALTGRLAEKAVGEIAEERPPPQWWNDQRGNESDAEDSVARGFERHGLLWAFAISVALWIVLFALGLSVLFLLR